MVRSNLNHCTLASGFVFEFVCYASILYNKVPVPNSEGTPVIVAVLFFDSPVEDLLHWAFLNMSGLAVAHPLPVSSVVVDSSSMTTFFEVNGLVRVDILQCAIF
jgi:hypothetical protein